MRELSPSAGTEIPAFLFRLMLAMASVVGYAVLAKFAPLLETLDSLPGANILFRLLVGAIFGALVLAPCVRAPNRAARGIFLTVASAAIYYAAIRFVVDGPAGLEPLASLVLAGVGSALLCGLAVALIAPREFTRRLGLALTVAGAVGGAVFDLKLAFDPDLLIGHAAWQLLVFLALYFGERGRPFT